MPSISNAKPLPSIFITKTKVNELVTNYEANKLPILSAAISKSDTKSAWYSLEQFEELMREMYYQNADGMRIYFGAYDSEDLLYANQLTVIFVPTYLNETTGLHTDIILDDEDDFIDRNGLSAKRMNKNGGEDIKKNLDSIGLCPPTCSVQDTKYPLIP
jgi:hypothetical protein